MGPNAPVAAVVTGALPVVFGIWKEGFAAIQVAGFGVALVAIWMIALPAADLGRPKGLGLAIGAGLGFGCTWCAANKLRTEAVFWPLVALALRPMSEMLAIVTAERQPWKPTRNCCPMMVAGVLDSFGNTLFCRGRASWSTRRRNRSVVALSGDYCFACTVRFKERISRLQTVGMMAALIAVPLIAAG